MNCVSFFPLFHICLCYIPWLILEREREKDWERERERELACMHWSLSRVWLSVAPLTIAHQDPLSMGFSRQEYWNELPFLPPGDLPDPGIKTVAPMTPTLQEDSFTAEPSGKPSRYIVTENITDFMKTKKIFRRSTSYFIKYYLFKVCQEKIVPILIGFLVDLTPFSHLNSSCFAKRVPFATITNLNVSVRLLSPSM